MLVQTNILAFENGLPLILHPANHEGQARAVITYV
jgi:hypothetical protein